jgi:hypothetical protein
LSEAGNTPASSQREGDLLFPSRWCLSQAAGSRARRGSGGGRQAQLGWLGGWLAAAIALACGMPSAPAAPPAPDPADSARLATPLPAVETATAIAEYQVAESRRRLATAVSAQALGDADRATAAAQEAYELGQSDAAAARRAGDFLTRIPAQATTAAQARLQVTQYTPQPTVDLPFNRRRGEPGAADGLRCC